jgi:hypothetical protein
MNSSRGSHTLCFFLNSAQLLRAPATDIDTCPKWSFWGVQRISHINIGNPPQPKLLPSNLKPGLAVGRASNRKSRSSIAFNGPMIYMALYIIYFWCGQIHYEGQWEGEGPGNPDFFGPLKFYRALRRMPFGAQNSLNFQGPTPSHRPKYRFACIKSITYRTVSIRGPQVVLCTWASRAQSSTLEDYRSGRLTILTNVYNCKDCPSAFMLSKTPYHINLSPVSKVAHKDSAHALAEDRGQTHVAHLSLTDTYRQER